MFQTILISSPLLVLFLLSLVMFVVGLRNYLFRREKRSFDLNERSSLSIFFGASVLAASGSVLLFVFTLSRTIIFVLFFCGIILLLVGGVTLRKLVIAGKEYIFSLSSVIIGMTLMALNFPVLLNIHEPFTMIYSFVIISIICMQIVMLESWKKKRDYENSIPIEEKLPEE